MINIYLNYKCPHCNKINNNVTPYQPSGGAYMSYNTGDNTTFMPDNRIEFTCYSCQKITMFGLTLGPPL